MKNRIIQLAIMLLLVLTSGVFWGTWISMTRTMEEFSSTEFIHIGKVIIQNVAWPMRVMMISVVLLLMAYLWTYPQKKSKGFYLNLKVLVLYLAAFLITVAILVPMDYEIKTWTINTVPQNWEAIRDKWKLFHSIRTFLSLASMGSFAHNLIFMERKM